MDLCVNKVKQKLRIRSRKLKKIFCNTSPVLQDEEVRHISIIFKQNFVLFPMKSVK